MVRKSISDRQASSRDIQISIGGECKSVSTRTIRRYLYQAGQIAYRPLKSPFLTHKHKQRRRIWAQQHKNWTTAMWTKVTFSDETAIELNKGQAKGYVRRRRGEKVKQTHAKAHKSFLKRLLVWGAIHASGPGLIVIMKGTLDCSKYLKIL